jgi:signal transduction histidine kinase/CheY-like chemotaxis protein
MTRRVVQRNAAGEPVAFLGVGIDITESRQAEQALRSARERAALASAAVGLGTWEVDLASGQTHWDAPMWTLRGHAPRPEAMTAEARLACVHPEDRARMAAANERGLREHVPLETEFRVVWPDGQVRWLASRAVSLFDDTGRAVRRIGVNWDITDHRRAAAAQQDSELARRENQAKSRFLSRMSHELRTPLNAVLGFAQLLLAAEQGDDAAARQRRRHLTHIERAGQHLLALINDVLDLSSLEGGEVRVVAQPVNLAELVSQALPLIQPLMTGQALSLHSEVPALHVLADPVRLRQALLNVLSNAVKYNRFGGAVRVTAAAEGAQVALRVADTGAGLSSEQLRHLFEPFNRLGAEQRGIEGTGIGLAIVRTLMERMGGSVSVTSTLGQGSEFTLRLPAARPEVPDAGAPPASGVGPPSGADPSPCPAPAGASPRPVVLYIEDNEINAIVVRELALRHGGAELRVAGTGAEGLRQARQLQPALLLLDMQLPDMDGRELLRQLRADPATAGLRCIALSAQAMPDQVHQALQAGVEAYWTKPLDFALFTRTLDGLAKAPGHPPQGPPAPYTPG